MRAKLCLSCSTIVVTTVLNFLASHIPPRPLEDQRPCERVVQFQFRQRWWAMEVHVRGLNHLEDQRRSGKELCRSSVKAFVCFNFGSLASYWPRPWTEFVVRLWAGRPPKRGPDISKRQPPTTQTASLECLWAAFAARASPRGPGASMRQPRRPRMGLPENAQR